MDDNRGRTAFHFLAMLAWFIALTGCSSVPQLSSQKTTQHIVIDGDNKEWKDIAAYIDNNKIAVSVCHDMEYFYLCLGLQDPQLQMQIMGNGLTVWLDNEGSDHKRFGIKFPLGNRGGGSPPMMDRERMAGPESMRRMMDQALFEMEVVGEKENDRYRLSITNTEGIKTQIGRSNEGTLVYELQVPLRKTPQHPHAIEMKDSSFVGLGVETETMDLPARKQGGERGGPPGGGGEMGFGGGGPPGGGGGRVPPGAPPAGGGNSAAVKMWWKVKLN